MLQKDFLGRTHLGHAEELRDAERETAQAPSELAHRGIRHTLHRSKYNGRLPPADPDGRGSLIRLFWPQIHSDDINDRMTKHEVLDKTQVERCKPDFSVEAAKRARAKTWLAVHELAKLIYPGMVEEEAQKLCQAKLAELGAEKNWHRVYVRFGKNTIKHYGVPSEPGVQLDENDLFYLDIGPVWDGYEGDAGDTFSVGSDPEHRRCAEDCRVIFDLTARAWKEQNLSGKSLYDFAEAEAKRRGWVLNLEVNGHRLSDFPHALYFKGSMTDADFALEPHLWVLEIQIRHPDREFGAFYEDWLS